MIDDYDHDDVIQGHLHCEDQNIVGFEEAEISEETEPDQKVPGA